MYEVTFLIFACAYTILMWIMCVITDKLNRERDKNDRLRERLEVTMSDKHMVQDMLTQAEIDKSIFIKKNKELFAKNEVLSNELERNLLENNDLPQRLEKALSALAREAKAHEITATELVERSNDANLGLFTKEVVIDATPQDAMDWAREKANES